jgi:ATP-dependent helicase/DNAse subunit B
VPEYIEAETEKIIKQKNGDDPRASFTLKAKIDRIDVDSKSKIFTVIDYKSGTPPHHTEIVSGTSLQLPLYLRAAEDLLRQNFGDVMTGVAGFYHRISSSENVKKPAILLKEYAEKVYNSKTSSSLIISLSSHQELADLIERTIEYANKYINGIQAGHFPLAAEERQEKVCKNCSYSKVCRLNESKKLPI